MTKYSKIKNAISYGIVRNITHDVSDVDCMTTRYPCSLETYIQLHPPINILDSMERIKNNTINHLHQALKGI